MGATYISNGHSAGRAKTLGTVKRRAGGTVMDAHQQWATRPADEAVFTFDDLVNRTHAMRSNCKELDAVQWGQLRVEPGEGALRLRTPQGGLALTHWATQQLCTVVGAPSDYLSRLPAQLASDALNHGLQNSCARTGDALLLMQRRADGRVAARSMTSDRYERVWDAEIAELADKLQRNGTWGPCEAFKTAEGQTPRAWSAAKTLPLGWVGDRSTFIALADYEGAVTINGAKLARFALLSNSEVGAQGLKIVFGLMDFACANFILWGCQQVTEVTARHVGSVRERFVQLTAPMTRALSSEQRGYLTSGLTAAQRTLVADTRADVLTRVSQVTRLPMVHIERAYELAEGTPRYGDPRSAWAMLSGLTEASQEIHVNADKRTAADAAAAKLMTLV